MNNGITWGPIHLGLSKANPYVITGGSVGRMESLAAKYFDDGWEVESNPNRRFETFHGTYTNDEGSIPVSAFATGMGASSVALTFPEVIQAAKESQRMRVIRIGTSGAMQNRVGLGHLVVAELVDSLERVSKDVMGHDYLARINPQFADALYENTLMTKLDLHDVHRGVIRVVAEPYLHAMGVPYMTNEQRGPALAVSMETSALQAYADLLSHRGMNPDLPEEVKAMIKNMPERDIQVATLLSISDNPLAHDQGEFENYHGNKGNLKASDVEDVQFRSALNTLVYMHNNNL